MGCTISYLLGIFKSSNSFWNSFFHCPLIIINHSIPSLIQSRPSFCLTAHITGTTRGSVRCETGTTPTCIPSCILDVACIASVKTLLLLFFLAWLLPQKHISFCHVNFPTTPFILWNPTLSVWKLAELGISVCRIRYACVYVPYVSESVWKSCVYRVRGGRGNTQPFRTFFET